MELVVLVLLPPLLMVVTLGLGLWLGRRDPWLPKLWYLVPFVVATVFAIKGTVSWIWLFGWIEALTIGWALFANRKNPGAAISFGLFLALYAVVWVFLRNLCPDPHMC